MGPETRRPEPAELLERVHAAARAGGAEETEIALQHSVAELTRFANNEIHQHVAETGSSLSVRTVLEGRTARASTNRLDAAGLRAVVERVLHLTRAQAPDPDLLPMPGPQHYAAVDRCDAATGAITPADRARQVGAMVEVAREHDLTAAGVCATHRARHALLNSRGLDARYEETGASFSVTMLAADSSGWAKGSSPRWSELDPIGGARTAAAKARASARPAELAPGVFTVVLEPAAVLDLMGFVFWDFGGLAVLDQRSFLTGRLGQKVFGDNINVADDVAHPLQSGAPFDGEGEPRRRVSLIENGWVRNLVYARETAARMRREHPDLQAQPTGHGFALPNEYGEMPLNVVFTGGDTPVEAMIASLERGIYVTRLWYIREVEPYRKILTGMTRDGTFLVENGKLAGGLRNFRFNQSMVETLNRVERLGPAVRASGEESFDMVVPAMQVGGFHFTEVTKF